MRILLLFVLTGVLVHFSFAQSPSYQKVLSVNGASSSAEAMVRTGDGGFVVAGETNVNGNAESFLSKFDTEGNEVWTRIYFDEQSHLQMSGVNDTEIFCNQFLRYLIATSDGGFVIGGGIDTSISVTYPNNVTSTWDYNRIYCMKTDSSGNLLWSHKFGLNDLDWSNAILEESHTGNLVMAGSVNQTGFVTHDNLIVKLDEQGNLMWSKSFGGNFDEGVSSIVEASNGDFVLCGTSESFSNNMDVYVVRMDSSGSTMWAKHYGSTSFDYGKSMMKASDGGFYFFVNAGASNPSYICLFKTDSSGAVEWANTYGSYPLDGPQSLFKLADGNFGAIVDHYTGDYNSVVVEIDTNGNYIQNRDYGKTGSSKNDFLTALIPDGTVNLICGSTNSFSGNQFMNQVYLIRTHDGLESDCNTDILDFASTPLTLSEGDAATVPVTANVQQYSMQITQIDSFLVVDTLCIAEYTAIQNPNVNSQSIEVFPNPASEIVNIQINDPSFTRGDFILSDVTGKISLHQNISSATTTLNVASLSNGIYFLLIKFDSGKSMQQKVIVSH